MFKELVSILIPVYNRQDLIEETVRSAMAQIYKDIEIIVVDNCSTDNTWEVLKKLSLEDKRIKIFQNPTNIGPVRNWLRCIDEASGKYGKILWSDDLIAPEFIEKTVLYLKNEDVGFVFTGTKIFTEGTDISSMHYFIGQSDIYNSDEYINGVLFGGDYPVSPGCALFRLDDLKKNLFENIPNNANSDFSMHAIGNDLLLFLLTAYQYKKFAFVNEPLSLFRAHDGSISIQSGNGKLPLHYGLATAYFLERYGGDLIKKWNTRIFLLNLKYKETSIKYNLNKIENFYTINKNYKLDLLFLVREIYLYIKRRIMK